MAQGKYFFIRSDLNGLVLDVENSNTFDGAPLVTWHQKPDGNENQQFYEDPGTGTIRTKLNDYCIDVQDDSLVISPYQPDSQSQQWMIAGNTIQNRMDPNNVFDIADHNEEPGARVCTWELNGGPNQTWSIENTSPRYFFLRSQMNDKVVDIRGADPSPGIKIIMYSQQDGMQDNQLWYEDRYGIIRSKLNDFAFDNAEGSMRMAPYDPSIPSRQWVLSGDLIVNRHDHTTVMDIKGASGSNGAKLISYEFNGGDNQKWILDYIE